MTIDGDFPSDSGMASLEIWQYHFNNIEFKYMVEVSISVIIKKIMFRDQEQVEMH